MTKRFTSKKAILEYDDRPTHEFYVPQWDATVILRELTAYQRDSFGANMDTSDPENLATMRARMVAMCLVDEDGELLFSQAEVAELGKKSSSAIDAIWDECRRLNGLVDDDENDDAVEEEVKN